MVGTWNIRIAVGVLLVVTAVGHLAPEQIQRTLLLIGSSFLAYVILATVIGIWQHHIMVGIVKWWALYRVVGYYGLEM